MRKRECEGAWVCVSILCVCMEANIRANMRREKARVFICRAGEVGGAQGR